MKRFLEVHLHDWKNRENRKPLLLRGARQVGKSWLISHFGKQNFENFVEINFEEEPELVSLFETFQIKTIVENIEILKDVKIVAGKTLVFLDEIQVCPSAITALRYFYEKYPQLHIVAAGSLLEFTLSEKSFRMPVGRVEFLYMYPLSFSEFLIAVHKEKLLSAVHNLPNKKMAKPIHDMLIQWLRRYLLLGGMPAVIQEYLDSGSIQECQRIQSLIIQGFRFDFSKYSTQSSERYLQKVFAGGVRQVGAKFKYSKIDNQIISRDLKYALELLEKAGLYSRVYCTDGSLPLGASIRDRHFKLIFLDVGLFQHIAGISEELVENKDLMAVYAGAVVEQFVGQELLCLQNPMEQGVLFYWENNRPTSEAELDYLIQKKSKIIPIEVKAGTTGRLKSLHQFMEKFQIEKGLKISQSEYNPSDSIISLPLYAMQLLEKNTRIFTN